MCGIAGISGRGNGGVADAMINALHHRGPDSKGTACLRDIAVAASRLAIVDLAGGAQPIYNETGELCIVFNGEIYNHRALRSILEQKGHRFSTHSDTEVVLHLYEEYDAKCVQQLRGMFAFAITDGERLFLARDRLGIKPLYYALLSDGKTFLFASEIKAILAFPEFSPRVDMQALADSAVLGHPIGTSTFIAGVRTLAPGHTMSVTCNGHPSVGEPVRYYPVGIERRGTLDMLEAERALEDALDEAVRMHLDADVDVGVLLSGGIDSTLMALLARTHHGASIKTFTVADHARHPDVVQAQFVATKIESVHRSIVPSFDEYLAAVPAHIAAEESPAELTALPMFLRSRRIAGALKVCLNGEGADELFGGYREYLDRPHKMSTLKRRVEVALRAGIRPSPQVELVMENLRSPPSYEAYLDAIFDFNLADRLERYHLNGVDKLAMAAGVEMRVPYLDDNLVSLVRGFPARVLVDPDLGIGKYLLKRLCIRKFGPEYLPIVLRRKLGLPSAGARHMEKLDKLCNEMLPSDYLSKHEFGRYFESKLRLLVFEMFVDIFTKHRGNPAPVGTVEDFIGARAGAKI